VEGVFFAPDFISVTKSADKTWQVMKPGILTTIMDHFVSGQSPTAAQENNGHAANKDGMNVAIIEKICELLDAKIRPAVAQDGGDITFESFESGIVYLNLKGACAGCPSSTATLKAGVENMLRHYIPEVNEVRQVR
jgi:Fe-S cluster biogenesis protein NfuA